MNLSRRQQAALTPIDEHAEPEDSGLQNPDDFLDRHHPENDAYMKSVEHVQRKIMHQTTLLRPKQVQLLKSVFSGNNYAVTAKLHNTTGQTVSRLVKSPNGQRLLNLLQYHLKLLEGPNEAQRRNMLWRIAVAEEKVNPKTSIAAVEQLNKMHFQQITIDNPLPNGTTAPVPQVVIHINQDLLPKGKLDR